jgi:transposase-like protein
VDICDAEKLTATLEEAEMRLAEFDAKWGAGYPSIVQSWQRNWPRIIPFFDYPAESDLHDQCHRVR